jgi:alkylation response protein AidB-like acyl-CoA dehydrogenase
LRARLVELEGHVLAHRASTLRRLTATQQDAPSALIDHVAKLYATDVMSRISDVAGDILADDLLGASDDPWGVGNETQTGYWVRDWYWSMAYAIAGGSSNVQRDVIARRGLGLSRG